MSVKVANTCEVCSETAGAFLGERGTEGDVVGAGVEAGDTNGFSEIVAVGEATAIEGVF